MFLAVLQVSQFLQLVNDALRAIPAREFAIEGEVSDYRISHNKWVYFDLKDEQAAAVLKCFASIWQLKVPLENGMRVRVRGVAKIYEKFGTFSLTVESVELVGEGALRRAYELLKKKLAEEGLFDPTRKRALPRFVERIGLITSRDAAAYGDFLRILNNRWGGVEVNFAHVSVQGREAVPSILAAFAHFNALPVEDRPQALVLVRGGGGLEDLHAFNDERVARAVFQSAIPVVCGVGHERDESLCDYVADVRASTPSNAAERVVPSRGEILSDLESTLIFLEGRLTDALRARRDQVAHAATAFGLVIHRERLRLETYVGQARDRSGAWFSQVRDRVDAGSRLLSQVDPKRVLSRGYSIVKAGGKVLRSAAQVDIGAGLQIQLAAGSLDAEVLRVDGKGKQKLM